MNKKFFKPATIERWCVAVYERPQRFGDREKYDMVRDLLGVCNSVGTSDGRRCCVICTTEPREIICWPCRFVTLYLLLLALELTGSIDVSPCAMTVEKIWRPDSRLRNTLVHAVEEGELLFFS